MNGAISPRVTVPDGQKVGLLPPRRAQGPAPHPWVMLSAFNCSIHFDRKVVVRTSQNTVPVAAGGLKVAPF